jgi:hypothetical protein
LNPHIQAEILSHAEAMSQQSAEAATLQVIRTNELVRKATLQQIAQNLRDMGQSEVTIKEGMGEYYCPVNSADHALPKRPAGVLPLTVTPPVKKPRKKDPRTCGIIVQGRGKTVEGREQMVSMNTDQKLAFLDQVSDPDPICYVNADRHWLNRINPIVQCYRHCCQRNNELFRTKYCNRKGHLSITHANQLARKCETCLSAKAQVAKNAAGHTEHDCEE